MLCWIPRGLIAAAVAVLAPLAARAGDASAPDAAGALSRDGVLLVQWGDPHPERAFDTPAPVVFQLATDDGVIELDLRGQEVTAQGLFGREVRVTGRAYAAKTAGERLAVESIGQLETPAPLARAPTTDATTIRRMLFLLVRFSDDGQVPHPPTFYRDLSNPLVPPAGSQVVSTINGFFVKTSWNRLRWSADVGGAGGVPAQGWLRLPHPKSYYANCGWNGSCANVDLLAQEAYAAGLAAGIDFTPYDNVNFVLSNDLDCCAWGGGTMLGGKFYGATWEPPWGQNTYTYAHELGHSIGLGHSGWVYYAYDSPWDAMSLDISINAAACGTYRSRNDGLVNTTLNCVEPGAGYIGAYRDYLGWLPDANRVVVPSGTGATVALQGLSLPLGAAPKLIRVCLGAENCDSTWPSHYVTVEARVRDLGTVSQYDNGIFQEGVIIHDYRSDRPAVGSGDPCFFNTQSWAAMPIDATPGDWDSVNCNEGGRSYPDFALYNAAWQPGQTWTDNANKLKISVQSRQGSQFTVRVTPLKPDAPAGVTATPGDQRVRVRWQETTAARSYNVLRGPTPDVAAASVLKSGVALTTLLDTAVVNGTTYFYFVQARNAAGTGPASTGVDATPQP